MDFFCQIYTICLLHTVYMDDGNGIWQTRNTFYYFLLKHNIHSS
jgi:hypothetical protein